VFEPLVALAPVGATVGEISAYAAGFSGQAVIGGRQYANIVPWMRRFRRRRSCWQPYPILFDLAGMAAGALRMPIVPFLFWCLLENASDADLRLLGAQSAEWLVVCCASGELVRLTALHIEIVWVGAFLEHQLGRLS
jgi:hypothetical protein